MYVLLSGDFATSLHHFVLPYPRGILVGSSAVFKKKRLKHFDFGIQHYYTIKLHSISPLMMNEEACAE
jgi:hypothetical protein